MRSKMETTKEKLERKLRKAKEGLEKTEEEYRRFVRVKEDRDYYKARVEKLTKLLAEL